MGDFPFCIEEVLTINGLPLPDKKTGYIKCPFCGGQKMHIDLHRGMYNCWSCDHSGGMVKLHAELNEARLNGESAYKDILQQLNIGKEAVKQRQIENAKKQPPREEPELPREKRDAINRALIAQTKLLPKHHDALIKRGATEEFIRERGYTSLPQDLNERYAIARRIQSAGISVKGGAGFFSDKNGNALLAYTVEGHTCPIRLLDGTVHGFQIRKDTWEKKEGKYSALSTPFKKDGSKMRSRVHYAGPYMYSEKFGHLIPDLRGKRKIKFTEGCLKADMFYCLTGEPILGILGVNNAVQLEETLKELLEYHPEIELVQDCLDMDYLTNVHVQKAIEKCKEIIEGLDLKYERMTWNPEFKGIDDFALAFKQGRYTKG